MRKLYFVNLVIFLVIFTVGIAILSEVAKANTIISGEISRDTTWIKANSPYILSGTITIPKYNTLTIEPGVEVSMTGAFDMFDLAGKIIANGTEDEPVIFDGNNNSRFINSVSGSSVTSADFSYCHIKNMRDLFNFRFSYFNLTNSEIENNTKHSVIYNPQGDVNIKFNNFINTAGWTVSQGSDGVVTFLNNSFDGLNTDLENIHSYLIKNVSNFNDSDVIFKYNTVKNIDGVILELESGSDNASIDAEENYWESLTEEEIEEKIKDNLDNKNIANIIEFLPILVKPHANTPGTIIISVPVVNVVTTPVSTEMQTITGTKLADTSLWVNGEEVVVLNTSTEWSYDQSLEIGENEINIIAKDELGNESEAVVVLITREEIEVVEEEEEEITEEPSSAEATEDKTDFVKRERELASQIDNKLALRLSGNILLQVEENGEAWYIYPEDQKKYYLGRPADAFNVMRNLGLGVTHKFISTYEIYPDHVVGKIILDVETNGEAYYINPQDKKAYYLGRPADAFSVMRNLGLGITNENVRRIEVGG